MRIVFLNPVSEVGGAERSLLAWMQGTLEAFPGSALYLLLPGEGLLADRARALGIAVQVLPLPDRLTRLGDSQLRGSRRAFGRTRLAARLLAATPSVRSYLGRLRRLLESLKPDLLHSNGIKTHLLLRMAAPAGVPIVWHLHDFVGHRLMVAKALRWASKHVTVAVGVSESVAADGRATLRCPVRAVANVTDVARFSPGAGDGARLDQLAELTPAPGGVVRVVLVATFARWKGQDVLLRAAANLRAQAPGALPPLRYYIVGGPIYRTGGSQFSVEELHGLASTLGVGADVGFIPYQPDPVEVYRSADIVVHASTLPEPFGLTIIEAMACGRPTVVARAGGAAELFTDGHDAMGVAPGDFTALAKMIEKLAVDAEARSQLGLNARQAAVQSFNAAHLPDRIRTLYAGLPVPPTLDASAKKARNL